MKIEKNMPSFLTKSNAFKNKVTKNCLIFPVESANPLKPALIVDTKMYDRENKIFYRINGQIEKASLAK